MRYETNQIPISSKNHFDNFNQPITKSNDVAQQMVPEATLPKEINKTETHQNKEQMDFQNIKAEPRSEIKDIPISEKLMAMHHAHLEQRSEMTDDSTLNGEPKVESVYKEKPHIEQDWNIISETSRDSGLNARTDSASSRELGLGKPVDVVSIPEVRQKTETEVIPEVKQSLAQKFMNMMGLNDRDVNSTQKTETEDSMESSVDVVGETVDVDPTIQENIINISEGPKYRDDTDIENNHLHAILEAKLSR